MNGGEFVDATIALVETKSKGSLALMGPNGGITKPSGWQPQGTETDGRGIGLQVTYQVQLMQLHGLQVTPPLQLHTKQTGRRKKKA